MNYTRGSIPNLDGYGDLGETLSIIRSLGFLSLKNGPWVGGGAVRRLLKYGDETVAENKDFQNIIDILKKHKSRREQDALSTDLGSYDIDIFLSSSTDALTDKMIDTILLGRGDCTKKDNGSKNHTEYVIQNRSVQVISSRRFACAEDVIADFDYTVCMAVTDGWYWKAAKDFFKDNEKKILVLMNDQKRYGSHLRLAKYTGRYGFTPAPGVLTKILRLDDEDIIEKFQNGHMKSNNQDYA